MTDKTTTVETAQPVRPKISAGTITKKTLLWATGVTPVVMLGREVKSTASIVGWALRNIFQSFSLNRELAKEDLKRAKTSPEEFWDEVVASAKITEQSLRKRYSIATYGAYITLGAISVSIGVLIAYQGAAAVTIGNAVLINILLIIYINHMHKLYTAREQKIITTTAFLRAAMKSPAIMAPQSLPTDYKLRKPPATSTATGD